MEELISSATLKVFLLVSSPW